MTESIQMVNEKIGILKDAIHILDEEYKRTDFHKKKEENPDSAVPSNPDDEDAVKLLSAIRQIERYVKYFQDKQFELLKQQE
jgi:hypothetical protein